MTTTKPERSEYLHIMKLKNQNNKVFYGKLTYVYIEMPNFTKEEDQLKTRLDKWLYFIKNLENFQSIPSIFRDEVFEQAFEKAEIANFRQADVERYEASLKVFRDNKATYDYAIEQAKEVGFEEGEQKGMIEGIEKGIEQGIQQGVEHGIEKGKLEKEIEIAKILKQKGIQAKTLLTSQDFQKMKSINSENDLADSELVLKTFLSQRKYLSTLWLALLSKAKHQ